MLARNAYPLVLDLLEGSILKNARDVIKIMLPFDPKASSHHQVQLRHWGEPIKKVRSIENMAYPRIVDLASSS